MTSNDALGLVPANHGHDGGIDKSNVEHRGIV